MGVTGISSGALNPMMAAQLTRLLVAGSNSAKQATIAVDAIDPIEAQPFQPSDDVETTGFYAVG